jgi:p-methyltransferase
VFCDEPLRVGNYRERDLALVKEEAEQLQNLGVDYLRFTDSLLNATPERLMQLADALAPVGIQWCGMVRLEHQLTESAFKHLYQAGCRSLWFGLESASPQTQKTLAKYADIPLAGKLLPAAHRAGISTTLLMMSDIPFETQENIDDTFAFLKEMHGVVDGIHVEEFRAMQGTPVAKNPHLYGISALEKEPLSSMLQHTAESINYTTSLRELWFSLKEIEEITLPEIDGKIFVTEL